MRTDARIDRKQVKLPAASTLGHDKWKAQFGDVVIFHYGEIANNSHIGRIAGRIDYAPAIAGDAEPSRNMLLVMVFDSSMQYVMERWIEPKQVDRCYTPTLKQRDLFEFMMSNDFKKRSPDELRQWSESGFPTWEEYQEFKEKGFQPPQ